MLLSAQRRCAGLHARQKIHRESVRERECYVCSSHQGLISWTIRHVMFVAGDAAKSSCVLVWQVKVVMKEVTNTQYVACMNPTAGSFNITPRMQRHFVTLAVQMPSPDIVRSGPCAYFVP